MKSYLLVFLLVCKYPLPKGPTLQQNYLPKAAQHTKERLENLMKNQNFSLAIDETSEKTGLSLALVCVIIPSGMFVLKCSTFEPGERMNNQKVVALVKDTLHEYNLESSNFVAYISDNTAYAVLAFDHLKPLYPNIVRVGCLSHILHLVSDVLLDTEYFDGATKIIKAANDAFAYRHSKAEQLLQDEFKSVFSVSGRRQFWIVPGRWACTLNSLIWLTENRRDLINFLEGFISKCTDLGLTARLNILLTALKLPENRTEITIVHSIAKDLLKLLLQSENADNIEAAKLLPQLKSFFSTMRALRDQAEICQMIVRDSIAQNEPLLVVPAPRLEKLMQAIQKSADKAVKKYERHIGDLEEILEAVQFLSPQSLLKLAASDTNFPKILKPYASSSFSLLNEWTRFVQNIPAMQAAYFALPPAMQPTTVKFWQHQEVAYPLLSTLASRLFTISTGISGVERKFKKIRQIQVPSRLALSPSSIENLMLVMCNKELVDEFQLKSDSEITDDDEE